MSNFVRAAACALLMACVVAFTAREQEAVLFELDLSAGVMPSNVAVISGAPVLMDWQGKRWLRVDRDTRFLVLLPRPLPLNFTVEYDLLLPAGESYSSILAAFWEKRDDRTGVAARCGPGPAGLETPEGGDAQFMELDLRRPVRCRLRVNAMQVEVSVNGKLAGTGVANFSRSNMLSFEVPPWPDALTLIGGIRITGRGPDAVPANQPQPVNPPRPIAVGTNFFRGRLNLAPVPGKCLAMHDGNILLRMSDGTVRHLPLVIEGTDQVAGYRSRLGQPLPGLNNVVAISASKQGGLALISDGTVRSWSVYTGVSTPKGMRPVEAGDVFALPLLDDVVGIATGDVRSFAIRSDRSLWTWGGNGGALSGIADFPVDAGDIVVPRPIPGLANVKDVLNMSHATYALLQDGSVRSFGFWRETETEWGFLGTGVEEDAFVPTPVAGVINAVQIAASESGGAVLLSDGTVKSWGIDQSFDRAPFRGATANTNTPTVVRGLRPAVAISHGAALFADGTVALWEIPRAGIFPVRGLTQVVALASEGLRSSGTRVALRANGDLVVWGSLLAPAQPTLIGNVGAETARQCALIPGP